MGGYTIKNLKTDVEDQAPNFGYSPHIEARMARVPLELEHSGITYQRIAPGFRIRHLYHDREEFTVVGEVKPGMDAN